MKQTAEFSRHFVNNLRSYTRPITPAEIVKPKATRAARQIAKVMSSSVKEA